MKRKYLLLLTISGSVIALDQLTKLYIHTAFLLHESYTVINNYFNLTYVRNPGAAFGFLANSNPAFREIFFLVMPPIAVVVILMLMKDIKDDDSANIIGHSLVFAGAIGNYIDRLRFRYVIDFLDFHYKGIYSWPAFNIADSAIVCGIILLLILSVLQKKSKEPEPTSAADPVSNWFFRYSQLLFGY